MPTPNYNLYVTPNYIYLLLNLHAHVATTILISESV